MFIAGEGSARGIPRDTVSAGGVKGHTLAEGQASVVIGEVGELGAAGQLEAEVQTIVGVVLVSQANQVGMEALTYVVVQK